MMELFTVTLWTFAAGYLGYWIGYLSRNKEVAEIEQQRNRLYRKSQRLERMNREYDYAMERMRHDR